MEKIDKRRKYTLDLDPFFKDSPDKYYWLGVLSTDGNIGNKEARIRLEIKDTDIDLLYKLKDFCLSNGPITYRTNNKNCHCASFCINSAKLKRYLAEYNIVPNKTKTFTMPLDKIPQEFLWHYVRGLMDGDGCITLLTTKEYHPYGISFVSANKKCVEQMKEIWQLPPTHAISENNGAFIVQKYGKDIIPILNKIYQNSTSKNRLDRKYQRYRSIIK